MMIMMIMMIMMMIVMMMAADNGDDGDDGVYILGIQVIVFSSGSFSLFIDTRKFSKNKNNDKKICHWNK